MTVTALASDNTIATGYTGTIHFTSSDGQAKLPANYTFTAADKGVHTFTGLILQKTGKQTITITDALLSFSDSVDVLPALLGQSQHGRTWLVEQSRNLAVRQGNWKLIEPERLGAADNS